MLKSLVWLTVLNLLAITSASACPKPWVFSDLGATTLVDTTKYDFDNSTGPITPAPGALEYLEQLQKAGYKVGLIVNVPAAWGATDDAKIFRIIDMIDRAWAGEEKMPWDIFGRIVSDGDENDRHFAGRFLVPDADEHRKPSPFLFERAVNMAAARGCGTLYMGTLKNEMPAAEAAGMAAFNVGTTDPAHRYLPVDAIPGYVQSYKPGAWNPETK